MKNPMVVALFRWFDTTEKNKEHIIEISLNSSSILVKLVGGQNDFITFSIDFLM